VYVCVGVCVCEACHFDGRSHVVCERERVCVCLGGWVGVWMCVLVKRATLIIVLLWCVCVCVYVCVGERECVCVGVCVCGCGCL